MRQVLVTVFQLPLFSLLTALWVGNVGASQEKSGSAASTHLPGAAILGGNSEPKSDMTEVGPDQEMRESKRPVRRSSKTLELTRRSGDRGLKAFDSPSATKPHNLKTSKFKKGKQKKEQRSNKQRPNKESTEEKLASTQSLTPSTNLAVVTSSGGTEREDDTSLPVVPPPLQAGSQHTETESNTKEIEQVTNIVSEFTEERQKADKPDTGEHTKETDPNEEVAHVSSGDEKGTEELGAKGNTEETEQVKGIVGISNSTQEDDEPVEGDQGTDIQSEEKQTTYTRISPVKVVTIDESETVQLPVYLQSIGNGSASASALTTTLKASDGWEMHSTWYEVEGSYYSPAYYLHSYKLGPVHIRIQFTPGQGTSPIGKKYTTGVVTVYAIPVGPIKTFKPVNTTDPTLPRLNMLLKLELRADSQEDERREELAVSEDKLQRLDTPATQAMSQLDNTHKASMHRLAGITSDYALQEVILITAGLGSRTSQAADESRALSGDTKEELAERIKKVLARVGEKAFGNFLEGDKYEEKLRDGLLNSHTDFISDNSDYMQLSSVDAELAFNGKLRRKISTLVPLGVTPPNQFTFAPPFKLTGVMLPQDSSIDQEGAGIYFIIDQDILLERVSNLIERYKPDEDGSDLIEAKSLISSTGEGDDAEPVIRIVSKGEDGSLYMLKHDVWVPVELQHGHEYGYEHEESPDQDRTVEHQPAQPVQSTSWLPWKWKWGKLVGWR
ncbi:hypothetical protein [Parendozoicomonas sp. Alg238-R29]|uniref:hypothetical protein n=1 Tax=Parendozoicomonas sp. Alg238-R29 TaxID=2993446 RepID=UPI00248DD283|nr:hypothetical protein [Parendozoicomonas sp. Alg238-R29]